MPEDAVSGDAIWITRPALAGRIAAALRTGPVLLVAGAGYGKTAALREALATTPWDQAWVACTAAHRDAGGLLDALVGALDRARPGLAARARERIGDAPAPVEVAALTAEIVADLGALLVDPLAVVFDDAEALAGAEGSLDLLAAIAAAEVSGLHVAVASRRELEVPARCVVVGETELAFDTEECAELLRAHLGRAPRDAEVDALAGATAGWPLGVRFTLHAGSPAAGDRDALGLSRFLASEVLGRQPADRRRALAESSVAPDLDPATLGDLGLPPDLADRARAMGLPLAPPNAGDPPRYHPFVREVLRDRLDADGDPARRAELLGRSAARARAEGRIADAVEDLLAAERYEEAGGVIAADGHDLAHTAWRTVTGWIDRLPPPQRSRPAVAVVAARAALADGRQPEADALLAGAERRYASAGDEPGLWLARSLRGGPLHEVGRWEELIAMADDFEPRLLATAGPAAAIVALLAATLLTATGRGDEGEPLARSVLESPLGPALEPLDLARRAYAGVPAGEVDAVRREVEAVAAELARADPFRLAPIVLGTLGLVLTEQGHRDLALGCWERMVAAVAETGTHRGIAVHAHLARATGLALAGRGAEAEAELALARPLPELGFRASWAHQAQAAIAWVRNDRSTAVEHAEEAIALVQRSPTSGDRMWAITVAAPVLAGFGEAERALAAVTEAQACVDRQLPGAHGSFWRSALLAERACLRAELGDGEGADADLVAVFEEAGASAEHVVRRTWPRLRAPLAGALARGHLDAVAVMRFVTAARPGGAAAVDLLEHERMDVRRAAVVAAAASGHPRGPAGLEQLAADPDAGGAARAALARMRAEPPPLAIELLGGFEARRGERTVDRSEWRRPVAATLVRYLAVHRDRPVRAEDLFDALWPRRDEPAARRALEVALSDARRVLEPIRGQPARVVRSGALYRLELGPRDRIDSEDFETAANAALRAGEGRSALLEHAASLWSGEPLPEERDADWCRAWRDALHDLYLAVLAALSDERLDAGDAPAAAVSARRMLAVDPTDEAAHRRLIVAYARAGRRGRALRQFLECRHALVTRLGVEPDEETTRLQARVLAGEGI